ETLHEWRKQAKYLRYQLEILRPLWPDQIGELAHEADRMGVLLGDDHDLVLLRQKLKSDADHFDNKTDLETLAALIDRRRAGLAQEAMQLGRRFFRETARNFQRRLKGYWKEWRAASATEQLRPIQPVPA